MDEKSTTHKIAPVAGFIPGAIFLLCLSTPSGVAQMAEGSEHPEPVGPVLDLIKAEHMFNRFGFGAGPTELQAVVGMRSSELFDLWIAASVVPKKPELIYFTKWDYGYDANSHEVFGAPINKLPLAEQKARQEEFRIADRHQFREYVDSVFDQMAEAPSPLVERLALFWHGFFPTSSKTVLRRYELIQQYHFLRTNALGGFDDLLSGIVKDPAMLGYFDNDTNGKEQPNENFARELMELYSLGLDNYTEVDVREAARTLTGYQGETGRFVFDEDLHDFGEKTILGQTGNFDGADLVKILLQQQACARHVSSRLLTWMEGLSPSPDRVEQYAQLLRDEEYQMIPWLRQLATDPAFFRPEAIGTRVQAPIEFLVSASHRLGIKSRSTFVFFAATLAGQQFYAPPSVKGWDEGAAWISDSSMITRGNCVGLLLGHLQEHMRELKSGGPQTEAKQRINRMSTKLRGYGLELPELARAARLAIGPQAADEKLIDWVATAYLARAPDEATIESLRAEVEWCREHFGATGPLLKSEAASRILRHLAYTLLRSPIGQLG